MTSQLVCGALIIAIWQRHSKVCLTVYLDSGSQLASKAYRRLLKVHVFVGIIPIAAIRWDNSWADSFFGSSKQGECSGAVTKRATRPNIT